MNARLFHLAVQGPWRAHRARGDGDWKPASWASEGFLHLSFEHQLDGTLQAHFDGHTTLVLLEIDPARVQADLRLETSRADALFPHLYRPLRQADILREWTLDRTSDGWSLPNAL